MQSRLGPMEAGPYGSLQLLAEVGKWLQKEDIFTENADRFVFGLARSSSWCSTFLMFVVIPGGPNAVVADLPDRHLLRAGDVVDLGDRHPHGGLGVGQQVRPPRWPARRRASSIAYELPMVLAVIGVVIQAGTPEPAADRRTPRSSGEIFGIGRPSATRTSSPSSSGS